MKEKLNIEGLYYLTLIKCGGIRDNITDEKEAEIREFIEKAYNCQTPPTSSDPIPFMSIDPIRYLNLIGEAYFAGIRNIKIRGPKDLLKKIPIMQTKALSYLQNQDKRATQKELGEALDRVWSIFDSFKDQIEIPTTEGRTIPVEFL